MVTTIHAVRIIYLGSEFQGTSDSQSEILCTSVPTVGDCVVVNNGKSHMIVRQVTFKPELDQEIHESIPVARPTLTLGEMTLGEKDHLAKMLGLI